MLLKPCHPGELTRTLARQHTRRWDFTVNRTTLLGYVARSRACQSYLEIGCNRDGTFQQVAIRQRVGIDPKRGGTLRMTSDEFFAVNQQAFDLVFIDGLHVRQQVLRDVENALRCLSPHGCIVIHDCLPTERRQQLREPAGGREPWTGDVWKAVVELRQRPDLDIAVLDADSGLGVLFARLNSDLLLDSGDLEWEDYVAGRNRLLRVVDAVGIREFIDTGAVTAKPDRAGKVAEFASQPGWRAADVSPPVDVSPGTGRWADARRSPQRSEGVADFVVPAVESADRLVIVFAHSNLAQFRTLHQYLNQSGLATSYLLCSENNWKKHGESIPNLVPFQPHGGKLKSDDSFYYLTRVEGAKRRSLGILKTLKTLRAQTRIDLFVGHVTAGSPSLLFGEVDFPIVTYLEYPSCHTHGWDAQYPPPDIKIRRDRNFEMLTS